MEKVTRERILRSAEYKRGKTVQREEAEKECMKLDKVEGLDFQGRVGKFLACAQWMEDWKMEKEEILLRISKEEANPHFVVLGLWIIRTRRNLGMEEKKRILEKFREDGRRVLVVDEEEEREWKLGEFVKRIMEGGRIVGVHVPEHI